jgi:hypothetical protein
LIEAFGYDLVPKAVSPSHRYPPDFSAEDVEIVEAVAPFTMTSPERIFALIRAVEYITRAGIPGDIVECGVWKGGSMMAVAKALLRARDTSRRLYLFDTYEGMPPPSDSDRDYRGLRAAEVMEAQPRETSWTWAVAPMEGVKRVMDGVGYRGEICYIRGRVEDTIPVAAPDQIGLLRLDTDWYESTYHEIFHLYPRLAPGGVLIVDDYGHWKGARRAIDQYFAEKGIVILLDRIDYTGRIGVKPR